MAVRTTGSQYLERTASLPSNGAATLCGWIRLREAVTSGWKAAFSWGNTTDSVIFLGVEGNSNGWCVFNSAGAQSNFATRPANGDWVFMAMVSSGTGAGGLKGYQRINQGAIQETGAITSAITGGITDIRVSTTTFDGSDFIQGAFAHVKCWDRALTADEILAESNCTRPVDARNLNFYWPLWDNNWQAKDLSINNRPATVSGTLSTAEDGPPVSWGADLIVPQASATGGTTHTTTGDLSAQAASVAGAATHLALHTTTGALASQAATVAGAAVHPHTTTGALAAQAATIAGTASSAIEHPTSGSLAAQDATVAGSATHLTLHTTTGALAADAATVVGAAVHPHTTTGALASQDAEVAGSAEHAAPTGTHPTDGALAADAATVAGSATRLALHTTTGALAADVATVAGSAVHLTVHTTTGALEAQSATISGTAQNGEFVEPETKGSLLWLGGNEQQSREKHADAQQKRAERVRAERIKLGIIEPDVAEIQQKAPVVAKTQQFLPSDWVVKEQEIAKEAEQVAAKKEAVEQGTEDYWALHLYEQLLRRESERLAQEAIAEARRKAEEADVAFVIMTLAALQ